MEEIVAQLEFGEGRAAETDHGLRQLEIITVSGIQIDREAASIREQLVTVRAYQLTAYDAFYLELARREGLPLTTLDKGLRVAAKKAGVALKGVGLPCGSCRKGGAEQRNLRD